MNQGDAPEGRGVLHRTCYNDSETLASSDAYVPRVSREVIQAVESAHRIHRDAARAYASALGPKAFERARALAVGLEHDREHLLRLMGPIDVVAQHARRFEEQRRSLERVLGTAADYERMVRRIRELVIGPLQAWRELDEKEERLASILASRGWVISPSLPVAATDALLKVYDEDGLDALEQTLLAHYDSKTIAELLRDCYDRPSFASRRHLFEPALDAHRRGEYVLSVPIWLMQVDGIVFEELAIDDVFSKIRAKKRRRQLERELGGKDDASHLLTGLLDVLEAAGESARQPTVDDVRRHLVLHGIDVGYGTERNSIQGVLMLELLHMFFLLRDRRSEAA